ncbi:MAG: NAD(P)H-dependent oxidoreductase [Desulfobacteraceae bacterium]
MAVILVTYHSQGGNTRRMAESAAAGAGDTDTGSAVLKAAGETTLEDLRLCDGIILGSPEYFGYMAGMIKDFFDRTYEVAAANVNEFRKPYALFISAGNDGRNTEVQMERILKGFPFKKVYETVICRGPIRDDILDRCFEMGQTLAAGCDLGIY